MTVTSGRRRQTREERRERRASVADPQVVMDAAAAFLSVRQRSVAETRRRLRHLGYRHDLVDQVVDRLVEMRYLDDESFARSWVESRDRARPRGAVALRRELALKGVERSVVDSVLADRGDRSAMESDGAGASADAVAARRLLERRLPTLLREADPQKRRQKAYALLARNGFDPEVCREVAAAVIEPWSGDRVAGDDA